MCEGQCEGEGIGEGEGEDEEMEMKDGRDFAGLGNVRAVGL